MTAHRILLPASGRDVHLEGLRDLAEALHYALLRLGASAGVVDRAERGSGRLIVLGAHALDAQALAELPPDSILYNLEQITDDLFARTPHYRDALRRFAAWDYDAANAARYAAFGLPPPAAVVPVGYVPEWTRIVPAAQPDIDVLFYGSLNERRLGILKELRAAGLRVEPHFGVYGPVRDALIGRAKVVLNIHFYEAQIFEAARVGYLLANRACVVAEAGERTVIDARLQDGLCVVPRAGIVDACVRLSRDADVRGALCERGFAAFGAVRYEDALQSALGLAAGPADKGPRYPAQINLGSGRDWREGWLNLDIDAYWRPDALLDVAAPLDLPLPLATERFGRLPLCAGMYERIMANDVMEHVSNLPAAMTNCLNLLKVGGELLVKVPYDLSYGAWQDPTHVRAFNERSFLYYTDWFWYLGWTDFRFDAQISFNLSELGKQLTAEGMNREELLRVPRAVDDLMVRLRKRATTPEEREEALARRGVARQASRAA
jgi:SAM-dependent methyltransferase